MPSPDEPKRRLRERGLLASWPVLSNQLDKYGSGFLTIKYREKTMTIWVREVPEFASKAEVPGYLIIRSTNASALSKPGQPDGCIEPLKNAEVRFLAKIIEVLMATGDRKKPYVWFIGDCGVELTVGSRIRWGRRLRSGDLIEGSGTVELQPDFYQVNSERCPV